MQDIGSQLPGSIREGRRRPRQFKQRFNAVSMRDRLAGSGYPRAFVVQNGEPYYYVVLSSHDTQAEAVKALKSIPTGFPVAMKAPLPYILCRP